MTQENIHKALVDLITWFNAIPGHQWYVFGTVAASIPAVIAIVEWVKRHHFNVKANELATHFIYLNIAFWATVMTVADFVITNGGHFATFLPFLARYMPVITAAAPAIYSFAKAAHAWFDARKASKQPFADTLPDLKPLVDQVTTPVVTEPPASTEPPKNVFGIGG